MKSKCPHCSVTFSSQRTHMELGADEEGQWFVDVIKCPECGRFNISLLMFHQGIRTAEKSFLVYPKTALRQPCPSEVPPEFAEDYKEACLVLADSPKASAALSRRCLQNLLREKAGVKPSSLAQEIQDVLDRKLLPSHLADALDAIRNIGNFAAHPVKSEKTGEIVSVELGEAEWSLDVLEGLFDFYFVQPAVMKKKKDDLNRKLADTGKPPMKEV